MIPALEFIGGIFVVFVLAELFVIALRRLWPETKGGQCQCGHPRYVHNPSGCHHQERMDKGEYPHAQLWQRCFCMTYIADRAASAQDEVAELRRMAGLEKR